MQQWLRKVNLLIDGGGEPLDLSLLRITFTITKSDAQTPNEAEITVYNLKDETAHAIKREFKRVTLQAGYQENYGVIFQGNIKQVLMGRENNTNSYLKIYAGDGDSAYNFAIVNTTLAAGATEEDRVKAATGAMGDHGVQTGHIGGLGNSKLARGKVMYGMAKDHLRQSAESNNASWSVQDGKVQFVPVDGVLPGTAVVLNSGSGLIGVPEQTNDGITAKCLINPSLRIGGRIQINNVDIQGSKIGKPEAKTTESTTPPAQLARITDDGFYKLLKVEYSGDTHGTDWYCNLTCLAINDTLPEKKVKG